MWNERCFCFDLYDFKSNSVNHTRTIITNQGTVRQTTHFAPKQNTIACDGAISYATCLRCGNFGPIRTDYCECGTHICTQLDRAEICCSKNHTGSCHCDNKGKARCLCA